MKEPLVILMIIGVAVIPNCGNKTNTTINTETPLIINIEDNTPTTNITPNEDDE